MGFREFIRTINFHELFMFIAVFALFIILGIFYHYNIIQLHVQRESICMKETARSKSTGVYNVEAKVNNSPAFDIAYDTMEKSFNINCACPEGDVVNTFTNIPYYDLNSSTPAGQRLKFKDKQLCNCETNISANANDTNVTYTGEPGLVGFMYDQTNTGFFNDILYGTNAEYLN